MATLQPYLNFDGNAEEAFLFYQSVFGGEFQMLSRYGDVPSDGQHPTADVNRVLHVALPIGKQSLLMASDRPSSFGPGTKGDCFYVCVNTESEAETKEIFNGLSAGGKVTMPLDKTFWNAYFGMLTDRFGINWMISYNYGAA